MNIEVFNSRKDKKIAVIGDIAVDLVNRVDSKRTISVETKQSVMNVDKETRHLGAAANVAANLASLECGHVAIFGLCGNDEDGDFLFKELDKRNIDSFGIIRPSYIRTSVYSKFYNNEQEEVQRIDYGMSNKLSEKDEDWLIQSIQAKLKGFDALIINHQIPNGLFTKSFVEKLSLILDGLDYPIYLDSRMDLSLLYKFSVIKCNDSEAFEKTGEKDLQKAAKRLFEKNAKAVLITRGCDGAIAFDGNKFYDSMGLHIISKTDPVGAGDAFISAFAIAYSCKASITDCLQWANLSAGISIKVIGQTGNPSYSEVLESSKDPDFRYRPDIAKDRREAVFFEDSEIEIINPSCIGAFSGPVKVAIFDHDGTLSTMRQGWEKIMGPMMVKAICGSHYSSLDETDLAKISARVESLIEKTTGIQTIIQMEQMIQLIKEYGFVKKKDIKTPLWYKDSYRSLMAVELEKKYKRFNQGYLGVEDLTMKGAIDALKALSQRGTSLYLASGTDYCDVKKELSCLGYEQYFNGGIYGSINDPKNDPKKIVMGQILSSIEVPAQACVVFGDGPVEMREGKKRGLLCVGIASDEHQRWGMNYSKRERLILAGADVIISDFSWIGDLFRLVGYQW